MLPATFKEIAAAGIQDTRLLVQSEVIQAAAAGSFDHFSEAMLVKSVKSLQRHFVDVTPLWQRFCVAKGSTVFDPGRHDALFLKSFLEERERLAGV